MAVSIQIFVTSEPDTAVGVADLRAQLQSAAVHPHFVFAFYSGDHDDSLLHGMLAEYAPGVPMIGGSSGRGVMSGAGVEADRSMGLMAITDPDGWYGAACAPLGDDPAGTAEALVHRALADADAGGELPNLIWVYQAPDSEEDVLAGIARVVGDRCPVVGGSSASGAPGALLRQLGPEGTLIGGLAIAVLFPSGGVSVSYQGGFEPTGEYGVATSPAGSAAARTGVSASAADADGSSYPLDLSAPAERASSREITLIDGESAAAVYQRWTGGALSEQIVEGAGDVSLTSVWFPLGIAEGTIGGLTYFRLVHVNSVTRGGGLRTFASVPDGTRVYAMRGSRSSLIHRAGRVAGSAMSMMRGEGREPAGALMVYCIGCRMAVGDEIDEVAHCADDGFGGTPFLGCFTSGEQGPVLVSNAHANLMISAIVFGR